MTRLQLGLVQELSKLDRRGLLFDSAYASLPPKKRAEAQSPYEANWFKIAGSSQQQHGHKEPRRAEPSAPRGTTQSGNDTPSKEELARYMLQACSDTELVKRIEQLERGAHEEGAEQKGLSETSLIGLLRFIRRLRPNRPSIVLTFDGNLRAEWRRNKDERLAIEFISEREIRFVLFAPSQSVPGYVTRLSGRMDAGEMVRVVPDGIRLLHA
jgi:hypothetical protein